MKLFYLGILFICSIIMSGCGQRGPLYLSPPPPSSPLPAPAAPKLLPADTVSSCHAPSQCEVNH